MVNFTPRLVHQEGNPLEDTIDSIMVKKFTYFRADEGIENAISRMVREDLTGAPVLDDQRRPVGFLSQRDCLKMATQLRYHNDQPGFVRDYMSHDHCCIGSKTKIFDAIQTFIDKWYHTYPVLNEQGAVIGLVTRNQILRLVNKMSQTNWRSLPKAS